MSSLTMSLVLQASLLAAAPNATPAQYDTAYQQMEQTGQPLVVLVGADWCPGCQTMKGSIIPQLRQRGILSKVAFASVNTDQQRSLAGKLMSGGSIPQLLMFYKTSDGWKRRQLTGAQSVTAVESFIDQGVRDTVTAQTVSTTEAIR